MDKNDSPIDDRPLAHAPSGALFDDRYGRGAYQRLLDDLGRPCVTFATIAKRLGVTRERVRQWQAQILPDAPRGHERQRQCAWRKRRRRLLEDPLFRTFFAAVRTYLTEGRVELIKGADGYRRRSVRIGGRTVALTVAPRASDSESTGGFPGYLLSPVRGTAEFIYFQLQNNEHLFIRRRDLPRQGVIFIDRPDSPFHACKNTFAPLTGRRVCHGSAIECRC